MTYIVEPQHCNQCLREVSVNKDGSLRTQNIKLHSVLSDIHTLRVYCAKHDYLMAMIPIQRVTRGKGKKVQYAK
jgi:hypothetical protein